ncbi:hypothetical protein [Brevundimonas subvibrioides]|uniref:hypothetical protein n=1 Tax=Brevundimonas subvibrioides TaxID=74313 RepID=UPI0022B58148|nr:hypothetical protein [Brevundimonas subvibrioides]
MARPKTAAGAGILKRTNPTTALPGAVVALVEALFAFVDPGLAGDANWGSLIANAR